ncbi:hypothetical protein GX51_01907 [Blastomyces parvus]|uniref:Rhodopsin domain-containing protein n=1 Tax=Blastomyces parvus TaxID=2060905 RepID=A0A2B7XDY3_9EURO|nr:hypothetical protein GX51_01907 [Blastomyces parvus]
MARTHNRTTSVSTGISVEKSQPKARGSSASGPELHINNLESRNGSFDPDSQQEWKPAIMDRGEREHKRMPSWLWHFDTAERLESNVKPQNVTWKSLPRKKQLVVLGLCRVFDFLQVTSLQAYMFFQLKSFDSSLSDSTISTQAGFLQGAFTAAQFATAVPWGRVADARWGGRKFVLLVGLIGTGVSCLGVAFSTSFNQAMFWRSFGGVINGMVGVIRTMIAENIREKRYQSRAFLILPIGFNIASLFGPVMGGFLADPVTSYPRLFGENSTFGGDAGVKWLKKYPFALPMILNAVLMTICAVLVALFLEETLDICRHGPTLWSRLVGIITRTLGFFSYHASHRYSRPAFQDSEGSQQLLENPTEGSHEYELEERASKARQPSPVLPFHRIWTSNVLCTLLAQAFFDFQMGAFNNLWLLFLSTPRYDPTDPSSPPQKFPFVFTGGLGMPPQSVGFATSIVGIIGMVLQFSIYPSINARLGTVLSRTFTLPASIILLNNCSPHPSVLGTVHGIGQSVSSAFRTIGPVFAGSWYGLGLEIVIELCRVAMLNIAEHELGGVSCVDVDSPRLSESRGSRRETGLSALVVPELLDAELEFAQSNAQSQISILLVSYSDFPATSMRWTSEATQIVVCAALGSFQILFRCGYRLLVMGGVIKSSNRSWGPDDSWMAFALLPLICRSVSMIKVFGLKLSPSIDDQRLETGSNKVHYALQFLRAFIVATFFATLLATLLECKPMYMFWSHEYSHHPCRKGMSNLLTMGSLNIVTDIALILFPIPMLWRMTSLDFQAKLQLTLLFLVGILVVAITITRLPLILSHSVAQTTRSLWASIEIVCASIVANASFYYALWQGSNRYRAHPGVYDDSSTPFQLSPRPRNESDSRLSTP